MAFAPPFLGATPALMSLVGPNPVIDPVSRFIGPKNHIKFHFDSLLNTPSVGELIPRSTWSILETR